MCGTENTVQILASTRVFNSANNTDMTNGADLAVGPVAAQWRELCFQHQSAEAATVSTLLQRSSSAVRLILGWQQLPRKKLAH